MEKEDIYGIGGWVLLLMGILFAGLLNYTHMDIFVGALILFILAIAEFEGKKRKK